MPGIVGINIPYTADGLPRLTPFCFAWFAHELAHTKTYLINSIAYDHGWLFADNPADLSPTIPRYGRSLPVRTLIQLPYVHLYEWTLLMDFYENGFRELPWRVTDDPHDFVDDLQSEIKEAFELIDGVAELTALGVETRTLMTSFYAEERRRWNQLCRRRHRTTVAGFANPVDSSI